MIYFFFNNFENLFIQIFSIILLLVSCDTSGRTDNENNFFSYLIFLSFIIFHIILKLFKSGCGCHSNVSNQIDIKK